MSCKVLNRLRVHPCIEKIGNVSVPQLMWCHIKIYRISDFGLILLCHAQRWSNCIFDTLRQNSRRHNKNRAVRLTADRPIFCIGQRSEYRDAKD